MSLTKFKHTLIMCNINNNRTRLEPPSTKRNWAIDCKHVLSSSLIEKESRDVWRGRYEKTQMLSEAVLCIRTDRTFVKRSVEFPTRPTFNLPSSLRVKVKFRPDTTHAAPSLFLPWRYLKNVSKVLVLRERNLLRKLD
jgi:hypothetical protein